MNKSADSQPLSNRQQWYREVYLRSPHWRKLRAQKLSVSPACQDCGSVGELDVHHVVYRDLAHVEPADLRTLCRSCHDLRHQRRSVAERTAKADAIAAVFEMRWKLKSVRRKFNVELAEKRKAEKAKRQATKLRRKATLAFKSYALHCLEDARNKVASPHQLKFLKQNHKLIAQINSF